MFIDRCKVHVKAGDGGNGCCSFRREKHVPRGGPDGGNGGRGGDIIALLDPGQHVLVELHSRPFYKAENGNNGEGSDKTGAAGASTILRVPPGTVFYDEASGEQLVDITHETPRAVLAQGGRGGLGNTVFATAGNRAPRKCTPGQPGEERHLIAELKMVADVGLVGYPNAGKSTLINRITHAHAKIGDYPFTTLHPVLGTIQCDDGRAILVADIPGIIEGAHTGAGLGLDFLRHIERTNLLVYVIDIGPEREQEPVETWRALRNEIEAYDRKILARPGIVALNKIDVLLDDMIDDEVATFVRDSGVDPQATPVLAVSAEDDRGVDTLRAAIEQLYTTQQQTKAPTP